MHYICLFKDHKLSHTVGFGHFPNIVFEDFSEKHHKKIERV